jgi:hypothetical protein
MNRTVHSGGYGHNPFGKIDIAQGGACELLVPVRCDTHTFILCPFDHSGLPFKHGHRILTLRCIEP